MLLSYSRMDWNFTLEGRSERRKICPMCVVWFSIDNLSPFPADNFPSSSRDISRPNDKKTRRISRSRRRVVRYLVRDGIFHARGVSREIRKELEREKNIFENNIEKRIIIIIKRRKFRFLKFDDHRNH